MKKYKIKISIEGAAFEDYGVQHELSRILMDLSADISCSIMLDRKALYDVNGNRVGIAYTCFEDEDM